MKRIDSITIVFDNLESMSFSTSDIGAFVLDKISEHVFRVAVNAVISEKTCGEVFIELMPSAEVNFEDTHNDGPCSKFDRLKSWQDIAEIHLVYSGGAIEPFVVEWTDSGGRNERQQTFLSDNGALYILIEENPDFKKWIDVGQVNSKEYAATFGIYS